MSESMQDQQFGEELSRLASAYPYPATPAIGASVPERLNQERNGRSSTLRLHPSRRVLAALALLLLLLAGLLAIPPVRAAVLRVLRIGAIEINLLDEPEALPESTLAAVSIVDLGEAVSAAEASERLGHELSLPEMLDEPDAYYYQQLAGLAPVVTMVWLSDGEMQLLLSQIGFGNFGLKWAAGDQIHNVQIEGREAVWIEGPHLLQLKDGATMPIAVPNNVLIWSEGEVTYRLEGRFSLEEARRLAESLP